MKESQEENYTSKNFRFRDFRFKARFEIFWIDSDQKQFLDQFFWLCYFFAILGLLAEKNRVPGKNFTRENFFEGAKKIFSKFNVKYIEMIPVKFSTTLIFSSRNFIFLNFRWTVHRDEKSKKNLSVGWESNFFQTQCQVYRNDHSQILHNFNFFVQELQIFSIFDELSTEMKNKKILSVRWESEKKFLPNSMSSI